MLSDFEFFAHQNAVALFVASLGKTAERKVQRVFEKRGVQHHLHEIIGTAVVNVVDFLDSPAFAVYFDRYDGVRDYARKQHKRDCDMYSRQNVEHTD